MAGIWAHEPGANSVDFPAPWEEGGLTKFNGQPALILGGSSSIGQYGETDPSCRTDRLLKSIYFQTAIQLAKLQGFSPIITTSSLKHAEYIKSIGATHVLDRSLSPEAISTEIPKLTGGKPITYAYDAIADETTQHIAYDALAADGSLVVSHPRSQAILETKVKRDGGAKKVAYPVGALQVPGNEKLGVELYAMLEEWLRSGVLVVSSGKTRCPGT